MKKYVILLVSGMGCLIGVLIPNISTDNAATFLCIPGALLFYFAGKAYYE